MRLIDADVLIKSIKYSGDLGGYIGAAVYHIKQVAIKYIEDAPSIDIVRCEECRWGKPYSDKQLECDAPGLGGLKFPNDFCSYGERGEQ